MTTSRKSADKADGGMKKIPIFIAILPIILLFVSGCGNGASNGNPLAGGFRAQQVSSGDYHACAIQGGGIVMCWGANGSGQLGNGSATGSVTPVRTSNIANATRVSAGGAHSCALINDGTIRCWGDDGFGQLGNNATLPALTPVQVAGVAGAVDISGGEGHTCAVISNGTVWCWGLNDYGQLGNGTQTTAFTPVRVSSIGTTLPKAVSVSAGGAHTCALLADGSVFCWGNNSSGQLGNGASFTNTPPSPAISTTPIQANLTGVSATALSAGADHTCAVMSDSTVRCWGDDTFGQLGIPYTVIGVGPGVITFSTFPVPVTGLSNAIGVTGGLRHSCATVSGGVRCWGDDSSGQLGNGAFFGPAPVDPINLPDTTWSPVSAIGLAAATGVSAGSLHTCAHLSNDVIACWGNNTYGQLGSGGFSASAIPLGVTD